jgi:putative hemolysin
MNDIAIEIIIVISLILLNGIFAMSEMAVVSSRKNRLEQKAEEGDRGARAALELANNPNRFLSTVQVGITLIGILSGAFGGATLAEEIGRSLARYPFLAPYSEAIGVGLVVLAITYLSLVLGELVPKRLAMNNPEQAAIRLSRLMRFIAVMTRPLVTFLSKSTDLILKILRVHPSPDPQVTDDDILSMLESGRQVGTIKKSEQDMVERILHFGDRSVTSVMTPRTNVVFIDRDSNQDKILSILKENPYSRFPVFSKTMDNLLGIVRTRDLLLQRVKGEPFQIQQASQQILYIPETTNLLTALERFKDNQTEIAVVIDEYGGVLGLVSIFDILESIVDDVVAVPGDIEADAIRREDGSWLFDGLLQIDDLKEILDLAEIPEEDGRYDTLNGMVMAVLGHIPTSGDHFEWEGYQFEVVDMDGRRVDKVLVIKNSLKNHDHQL